MAHFQMIDLFEIFQTYVHMVGGLPWSYQSFFEWKLAFPRNWSMEFTTAPSWINNWMISPWPCCAACHSAPWPWRSNTFTLLPREMRKRTMSWEDLRQKRQSPDQKSWFNCDLMRFNGDEWWWMVMNGDEWWWIVIYPLVNVYMAMENHHVYWVNPR